MSMLKHSLTYHQDSARLFERVAHEPWAMLLDSGQMIDQQTGKPGSQYGHYDILVARPIVTVVTEGEQTTIKEDENERVSEEDPFALLNTILSRYEGLETELPFAGGALGYFSYDLGHRIETLVDKNQSEQIPDMMIGIYDWAVVTDHRKQRSVLVSHGASELTRQDWDALCQLFDAPYKPLADSFEVTSKTRSNFSEASYGTAFDQIKSYIK